jgi:carbon monoxide dehydrogenase subunit G
MAVVATTLLAVTMLGGQPSVARAEAAVKIEIADDADGSSIRLAAQFVVTAPIAAVWAAMGSCERAKRYVTGLTSCTIEAQDPNGLWDVRVHIIERGWPIPKVTSRFRQDFQAPNVIRINRIDGDLKALSAVWRLTATDGGRKTEISYSGRIAMDTSVPRAILRPFVAADFRQTMQRMATDLATPGTP